MAARGLAAGIFALVALSGCAGRVVKTPVYEEKGVRVFLRETKRGGEGVDRGFAHPAVVAPVRVTNILSRIEVRGTGADAQREPAIPTGVLFGIGEGVSKALEQATPSQEVVVMAIEKRRSLSVFTNEYLTSLVLWVKGDKLFVYLGETDGVVSRDPRDEPKEPMVDEVTSKKQAVGSDFITAVGPRTVTAAWRDEVFRDASAIRVRPGGQVLRRTILMEEPAEEDAARTGAAPVPPESLSPEALRALADLEETRRRGQLSEADYQTRRRQILSGEIPSP